MPDDKAFSQLISQSFRIELSNEERAALDEHLESNEESRKYEALSRLIQDSVAGLRPESNAWQAADTIAPSGSFPEVELTQEAMERMKDSVSGAVLEKQSLSSAGLLSSFEKRESTEIATPGQTMPLSDEGSPDERRHLASRFRLIRRLGQGGLGNVWLARDEVLNRNVALKELNAEALKSPTAWERFHREAEITGQLEHPNVVRLYQYGNDRNSGEPFYVMRFVGKRSLADAIEEHHDKVAAGQADALSLHRLLSIFLDICQAIAYVHSRDVIHRDLKPENVALDNFGQVIVLDWGLAKVLEDGELAQKMKGPISLSDSTLDQTVAGDIVGTPLYMSPEQASGNLDDIDKRTDVYGLGAILFSILTGKAPHENSFARSDSSVQQVVKKIAEADTPRPSDYIDSVPFELDAICQKALARKRHLRHDSVEELAMEVESWIAGQSGKKAAYETLRMEGRELRSDMRSRVNDLERNVRFASGLPPIQELIDADSDESTLVWRERLASIFEGMIKANPCYRTLAYCQIHENEFSELVRVERPSFDAASIRTIPKSKLRTAKLNQYIDRVAECHPDEVHTSLVCDSVCQMSQYAEGKVGLLSSVPVYDQNTEEVFGFVTINCDFDKLLKEQVSRRYSASEIVVACDVFDILMHTQNGQVVEESMKKTLAEETPHFEKAAKFLQENMDYVNVDSDVYGARLWLIPNQHGIMYLLRR